MYLSRLIITTLALAVMSTPIFAGKKEYVCHQSDEGNHTIRISSKAVKAHLDHGDTMDKCPVLPVYKTVVLMRCMNDGVGDELGSVVVSSSSVSANALLPVNLDMEFGAKCSNAVAQMLEGDYSLEQISSGGTPLGLETEYLFIGESNEPAIEPAVQ